MRTLLSRTLRDGRTIDSFFRSLALAPQSLLMLDYDGTLSPFTQERNRAFPYPGVVDRLSRLMQLRRSRVVLISGRAVADLVPLLGMDRVPEIWGSHGWEHLLPDGAYRPPVLSDATVEGIRIAAMSARASVDERSVETKPASVALHWRGRAIPDTLLSEWKTIAGRFGLEVHSFDGGVELRPPGKGKGDAVGATIEGLPVESAIAYLGDDITDEDAFRTLGIRGLRVLVRKEERPTLADIMIDPPGEVLEFLDAWIDNVS